MDRRVAAALLVDVSTHIVDLGNMDKENICTWIFIKGKRQHPEDLQVMPIEAVAGANWLIHVVSASCVVQG